MCAGTALTGEPYRLAGSRLVFTNWIYVRPTAFGWHDGEGRNVSVHGDMEPDQAVMRRTHAAWGIRLAARPAARVGPILDRQRPWEDGNECLTTVIQEHGRYRAWGWVGGWGDLRSRGPSWFCTFESADGLQWERPALGIVDWRGLRDTNLLSESGGTVFVDPSASPAERYKWIAEHHFPREVCEQVVKDRPGEVDPRCVRDDAGLYVGARGAVSPDGYRWQVLPEPLVMTHTDTQVVACYDARLRRYVAYFRDWSVGPLADGAPDRGARRWLGVGRRAIGRAETADFRRFPLPELVLEPGPELNPSQVLYTNCFTTIPGAPDHPLMFPAVWDTTTDTTQIALAASHDGRVWHHLPGGPVLDTADFGQWDGGCVFASPNLVELPNGDFALPYTGYDVPHKYPRGQARRSTGYAVWPRGRLIALEAPESGEFTTAALIAPGNALLVNAVAARAGSVRIEALDLDGRPIPGRSMEEAVPLFGDLYHARVVWREHADLGAPAGTPVMLHIRLEQAALFGLEFGNV
jgi:hypothetical protein